MNTNLKPSSKVIQIISERAPQHLIDAGGAESLITALCVDGSIWSGIVGQDSKVLWTRILEAPEQVTNRPKPNLEDIGGVQCKGIKK